MVDDGDDDDDASTTVDVTSSPWSSSVGVIQVVVTDGDVLVPPPAAAPLPLPLELEDPDPELDPDDDPLGGLPTGAVGSPGVLGGAGGLGRTGWRSASDGVRLAGLRGGGGSGRPPGRVGAGRVPIETVGCSGMGPICDRIAKLVSLPLKLRPPIADPDDGGGCTAHAGCILASSALTLRLPM